MNIKTFIASRGITQKDLAEVLGISMASMSRRATGKVEMTVGDLQKIYEAYSPLSEEEKRFLFTPN